MDELDNHAKAFFSRLEQTWSFYLDIEKEVLKKINVYNRQISEEGSELFPEFIGFDGRYKGLLREGLLIQLCSLLEYSIVQICMHIIPDYDATLKKKRGNWLKKHLSLLGQKNINGLEDNDVTYFSDFIQIRNCLVHSNGIIHQYKYRNQLEDSVKRLQEHGNDIGTNIIQLSEDGYLLLGPDALNEVFVRGEGVMRPIFEYAFQELTE